ncbi:hypothetical protein [Bradyrhizobium sp.]|uniref:hypothetical protein n=1 Tax=Bradyrhizobium sp. TaxID=376 RepID=UPI0039E60ED3
MIAQPNLAVVDGKSTVAKDERGRFVSGPGNVGRPLGSRNKQSSELMKLVRAMGPRAVEKLSDALDDKESPSHWKALELILKYCLPSSRTIEMDDLTPAAIRDAFVNAELSADEMKSVATAIEKLRSVETMDEFEARLSKLEATAQR